MWGGRGWEPASHARVGAVERSRPLRGTVGYAAQLGPSRPSLNPPPGTGREERARRRLLLSRHRDSLPLRHLGAAGLWESAAPEGADPPRR